MSGISPTLKSSPTLETTARNFRTYLAQCGNAIVEHENEDEFLTDVFYTLLNRRTAVQVPLQERIQDVLRQLSGPERCHSAGQDTSRRLYDPALTGF